MISVVERKYWNQLRNGETFSSNTSDFTDYLLATIGEKIKAQFTVDVFWYSEGKQYIDEWSMISLGGFCTVKRQANSFLVDEFRVGDTIYWTDPSFGTGTGTIISLTALEMVFSESTGYIDDSLGKHYACYIYGTTALTGGIYKYNFIENSDAVTFTSKIDQNTISYSGDGFTGTDTLLVEQGNFKSWKDDGSVSIKTGTSGVAWKQRFIITHEFWITPLYLPDQNADLQLGIPPTYLKASKSLKYVFSLEMRQSLYNPNMVHAGTEAVMLGDVSWYDEHFDGFNPVEFNKQSIAYSVNGAATSGLNANILTHVICEVNSVNNLFSSGNTNFLLNILSLPVDDVDFKDTTTTMFENYLFDQCFSTIGAASKTSINGIMTNVVATKVGTKLHVEFDVEYTNAQALIATGREYIITITTDSHIETHVSSKRVQVLFDFGSFDSEATADIPDLIVFGTSKYWEHPWNVSATSGNRNFRGWISDGIYNETSFTISEEAYLNNVRINIRAYNSVTLEQFDLMNYDIPLASFPVQADIRNVNIDTTRGFKLINGSEGNFVKLSNIARTYYLKFALKLRWEDWMQLLDANTDFFDSTKENNGLSHHWSNYFNPASDWKLQIRQICTAELIYGSPVGALTDYEMISNLDINEFDEDGNTPPLWTASLETLKGVTSLGVDNNAKIDNSTDTKIVVTFTAANSLTGAGLYGIIMIGTTDVDGIYSQHQLSTEELPVVGCWLKPVTGQTKCKLTISGNTAILEAMVDYTKIVGEQTIMARIGYNCQDTDEVRARRNYYRS